MKTWIFAHPVWSTVIGIAILTGIILLISFLSKSAPAPASQAPANPNPNPEPAPAPNVPTNTQVPNSTVRDNNMMGNLSMGRVGWTIGSGRTATGGGMGGSRVGHAKG